MHILSRILYTSLAILLVHNDNKKNFITPMCYCFNLSFPCSKWPPFNNINVLYSHCQSLRFLCVYTMQRLYTSERRMKSLLGRNRWEYLVTRSLNATICGTGFSGSRRRMACWHFLVNITFFYMHACTVHLTLQMVLDVYENTVIEVPPSFYVSDVRHYLFELLCYILEID